jgi:autotransporter strand-loop-strand O-heptosyltransferase
MITYNLHHVKGLFFELLDDEGKNREYDITFSEGKEVIFETKLKPKSWAKLERKYLSDIKIVISYNGRVVKQINLLDEIKGNDIFISFESKSLGDTLAWMPYCLEFQKHYECQVIVSTFHNYLFEKKYPELKFVGRGMTVHNLKAMFELGWFWDKHKELINPILIPLQKTATNILNLPYKEILPILDFEPTDKPINDKYVCISIHSTAQLKHWYYWQKVINYLTEKGYKVIEISKEETKDLQNIESIEDKSLENTMNYIHHCEFFIGLSSGLGWLSWALGKKQIMIANFTNKDHEYTNNTIRIVNHNVCHGCWNNPLFKFDKGNWNWCPEHEDTPRQFECHKGISAQSVIESINSILYS